MKVFLTQLRQYGHDLQQNLQQLTRLVERSRQQFSAEDILVLPELFGCDSYREVY